MNKKELALIRTNAAAYIDIRLHLVPFRDSENKPRYRDVDFPQKAIKSKAEITAHVIGNIALYHETSGTCALDIDNLERTKMVFESMGISLDEIANGAWEIDSGRPNRGKFIFEWPEALGPLPATKALRWPQKDDPKKYDTIFELRGANCHGDVLPPSIHPKTGKPYQWKFSPYDGGTKDIPHALVEIWKNWETHQDDKNRLIIGEREMMEQLCPWTKKKKLSVEPSVRNMRNVNPDARTVIDEFNARYDIDQILQGHGYQRKGRRYLAPGSSTQVPGVKVLPGTGSPRVYSHGASCPLADGRAHDAFSCSVVLEYGGDFKRAIQVAAEEFGITVRRSKTMSEKQIEKQQADTQAIRAAIKALAAIKDKEKLKAAADEIYEKIYSNAYIDDELAGEVTIKLQEIGMARDEVSNTMLDARERSENPFDQIDIFNETHAVVVNGGVKILRKGIDKNGQSKYDYMTKSEAQMLYADRFVSMGGEQKRLFDMWLQSPNRNTYTRLGMNPRVNDEVYEEHGEQCLNIYKGSPYKYIKPDERVELTKFLDFIRNIICDGNDEAYEYLINWCAHLVQRPWEMPGVAILMLSPEEGVGKGFLASCIGRLMPAHSFRFDSLEQITEKHNEHLQTGIVMFCDEATYGGDKKSEGILRGLITDSEVTINPKFGRQFQIERYTRLIISSNNRWPAPIQASDRRYFLLRPNPKYAAQANPMGNEQYYGELRRLMESEQGMAAWFSFLMDRDISSFSPRRMPATSAMELKQEISMKSMNSVDEYLVEALTTMIAPGEDDQQWKDVTVPRGPHAGKKLGPFSPMKKVVDAVALMAEGRRLRPPSLTEVRSRLLELGVCELKRSNGYPGFRFLPYNECVEVFCRAININTSIITGGEEESFYDEDLGTENDTF